MLGWIWVPGFEKAGDIWARQAEQRKADAAKWDALYGKIGAMQGIGLLSPTDADALAGVKNPDKLAGPMTIIEADINRREQEAIQSQKRVHPA